MAVLDPRLLSLLETLASAGADWLAFEIVDGVRRGHEPVELEELLRGAREKVRSRQFPNRLSADIPVSAEPILGDDQIIWAANYVADRLNGALADLDEGFALIEAVAENSRSTFGKDEPALSRFASDFPVKVALIGQDTPPIDRASVATARAGLASLRNALAFWSIEARGKPIL